MIQGLNDGLFQKCRIGNRSELICCQTLCVGDFLEAMHAWKVFIGSSDHRQGMAKQHRCMHNTQTSVLRSNLDFSRFDKYPTEVHVNYSRRA